LYTIKHKYKYKVGGTGGGQNTRMRKWSSSSHLYSRWIPTSISDGFFVQKGTISVSSEVVNIGAHKTKRFLIW